MKYLKKWSLLESINVDELKDLCDTSFANLYDLGFEVTILGTDQKVVFFKKNGGTIFHWDQVKDYYIPFLQLINKRYEIVGTNPVKTVHIQFIDWKYYSYDEIVNESVEIPNYGIYSIRILLKEKL